MEELGTATEIEATCEGVATEVAARCTGDNDGTGSGAACTLNSDGSECAGDTGSVDYNCQYHGSSYPVCDLDPSTDDMANCPLGCTFTEAFTPVATPVRDTGEAEAS